MITGWRNTVRVCRGERCHGERCQARSLYPFRQEWVHGEFCNAATAMEAIPEDWF